MSAAVRLICPNLKCRAVLSVPTHARGKNVRCRQCGMRVKVPMPAGGSAPAAGPSTPLADAAAKKAG